jgi:hypothetical protein
MTPGNLRAYRWLRQAQSPNCRSDYLAVPPTIASIRRARQERRSYKFPPIARLVCAGDQVAAVVAVRESAHLPANLAPLSLDALSLS